MIPLLFNFPSRKQTSFNFLQSPSSEITLLNCSAPPASPSQGAGQTRRPSTTRTLTTYLRLGRFSRLPLLFHCQPAQLPTSGSGEPAVQLSQQCSVSFSLSHTCRSHLASLGTLGLRVSADSESPRSPHQPQQIQTSL